MTTCERCGRAYSYSRESGHSLRRCNSCMVNGRRHEKKSLLVAYCGGACVVCGYNKCEQSLDFHHINPANKSFTVSGKHCLRLELLLKEVDKCIMVCRNCHSEGHAGLVDLKSYFEVQPRKPEAVKFVNFTSRVDPHEVVCLRCDKVFETKRKTSKFCSPECATSSRSRKPTKEQLCSDLREFTTTEVGENYGVTATAVAKWARSYGLSVKSLRFERESTRPSRRFNSPKGNPVLGDHHENIERR